jgi:hypothetical protein
MYIQYINKGQHQFRDNGVDVNMLAGDIKEVSDNTGRFLTARFKHSFIVASKPVPKPVVFKQPEIQKIIETQKPEEITVFEKKADTTDYKSSVRKIKKSYKE